MRQLLLLAFDVLMALALLFGGTAALWICHAPIWLAGLPFLPCGLWIRWRGGLDGVAWHWIVAFVLGVTAFSFVCEVLLHIGRGWQLVLLPVLGYGMLCLLHLLRRRSNAR